MGLMDKVSIGPEIFTDILQTHLTYHLQEIISISLL